ncbi:MAG: hypothetical protein GX854_04145, partial [Clostridiales bacterium]|nr:hypothetical protein [Clostridiales bacterium]
QADRAQDIADTYENETLPAAITAVEAAGQAEVGLAEQQANIAAGHAQTAAAKAEETSGYVNDAFEYKEAAEGAASIATEKAWEAANSAQIAEQQAGIAATKATEAYDSAERAKMSEEAVEGVADEHRLKIAKLEKELNDYKATMQQVNINQEPKQKVSGYGIISLPKNAANGQVSVTVKGNTETDEEGNTKSTIGAVRIKVVGKNLFNKTRTSKGFSLNPSNGSPQLIDSPAFCSDFIRVNNNERYYISGLLSKGFSLVAYYDKDKRFTRRSSASIGDRISISNLQDNEKYIRITVYDNESAPATWEDIDDVLNNLQVERGNVATAYETYQESNAYVIAKNEQGNVLELRSLPNGTKDEIRVSGGKAELVKRVSDEIVIDGAYTDLYNPIVATMEDCYRIQLQNWSVSNHALVNQYGSVYALLNRVAIEQNHPSWNSGGIWIHTNNSLYIKIDKTKIDSITGATTLDKFKTYLNQNPITLTYQLAEPIITPIQTSGNLISYPSGTVYVENVVADAGIYTDKMTVLYQDLPIKVLEKLSKIDFTTGLETELDVSETVIAGDKLSFTHPDLEAGDIVFFVYEYDRESTV